MKINKKKIVVIGNQWITQYFIKKLIDKKIKPFLIISSAVNNSKQTSGYVNLRNLAKK